MHPMERRRFLSLLLPALGLAGCGEAPRPPFRVATFLWPGYEPLFLARGLDYFAGHRIQLLEFPSVVECVLAFQNGVVDAVTLTLDEFIRVARTVPESRIGLMLDYSNGTDVILAKPEIADMASLKGRKVGVENNAMGAFFLARALGESGLSPGDIKLVTQRADRLEAEFSKGNLDAVVTYDPYRVRMKEAGARQIFDSSKIPGEIADCLVVRKGTIDSTPPALIALVAGWFRAVEYVAAHPADAAARMAPREGVTAEEFQRSLAGVQLLGRGENLRLLASKDSPLPAAMRRMADFLLKSGLMPGPVDTGSLVDGRLLAATSL